MLYFAYGSNMDWQQMRGRCPSARFVGRAVLPDYRLAFTRRSDARGCGVADAVLEKGRCVWGVVYEISDLDVGGLDTPEGYRPGREMNSYWRRGCVVLLDGDEQQPLTVSTYFAEREPDPPPPNQAYMDLLLSGARHWCLPDEYIKDLERIGVRG